MFTRKEAGVELGRPGWRGGAEHTGFQLLVNRRQAQLLSRVGNDAGA